jgi:hypothetical protein
MVTPGKRWIQTELSKQQKKKYREKDKDKQEREKREEATYKELEMKEGFHKERHCSV